MCQLCFEPPTTLSGRTRSDRCSKTLNEQISSMTAVIQRVNYYIQIEFYMAE